MDTIDLVLPATKLRGGVKKGKFAPELQDCLNSIQ